MSVLFSMLMSITSEITVGFRRTFAFVSGSTVGFKVLLILCAFGINSFISESLLKYLCIFSGIFLIYIGVKIFNYTTINFQEEKKN